MNHVAATSLPGTILWRELRDRLVTERVTRNISQEAVAARAGVAAQAVCRWENGKQAPSVLSFLAWLGALDLVAEMTPAPSFKTKLLATTAMTPPPMAPHSAHAG